MFDLSVKPPVDTDGEFLASIRDRHELKCSCHTGLAMLSRTKCPAVNVYFMAGLFLSAYFETLKYAGYRNQNSTHLRIYLYLICRNRNTVIGGGRCEVIRANLSGLIYDHPAILQLNECSLLFPKRFQAHDLEQLLESFFCFC